jgi:hypothetical protein
MADKIELTREELRSIVSKAVEDAMSKKWISPEEEYANDKFVCQLRESVDNIKSVTIRTMVSSMVLLILSGLALLLYFGRN